MAGRANFKNLFAPLYDLYLSHTNCDLVLVSSDQIKFEVHSIVIAASFQNIRQEIVAQKPTGLLSCIGIGKPNKKKTCHLEGVDERELRVLIKYSYLGTCDLSQFDCEILVDLLNTVISLEIADLGAQIEAYFKNNLTIKAAFKLFSLKNPGLERAFSLAEEFLLRHLLDQNFAELQVDFKSLVALLKDDRLNTQREELVWKAMENWVAQDKDVRAGFLDKLVKCLRIAFLSEDFMDNKIMQNSLILGNSKALIHLQLARKVVRDWFAKSETDREEPYEVRQRIPHQTIVVIGGFQADDQESFRPAEQLEFFNMNSNSWKTKTDWKMPWPRGYFAAEKVSDILYVVGGFSSEEPLKNCQKLDLSTSLWTDLPPMSKKRSYVSTAAQNGEIYVCGGKSSTERFRSVEKFVPADNSWVQVADMTTTRIDLALVNLNGVIFALGGFDGQLVLSSIEKFDPVQNVWTFGPRMVRPRSGLAAVVLDGCIFTFGGFDGNLWLADGEKFDSASKTWTLLAPMAFPRSNFGLVCADKLIYAVGGFCAQGGKESGAPIAEVEVYDPACNAWYSLDSISIPRAGLVCFVVDSLQFSLKIWNSDGANEKTKRIGNNKPVFGGTAQSASNDSEDLKLPDLAPLPGDWLRKYTAERGTLAPTQAQIDNDGPIIVAVTFSAVNDLN